MAHIEPNIGIDGPKDFEAYNVEVRTPGFSRYLDQAFDNPFSSESLAKIDKGAGFDTNSRQNVNQPSINQPEFNPWDYIDKSHSLEYQMAPNSVFDGKSFYNFGAQSPKTIADAAVGKFDFNC